MIEQAITIIAYGTAGFILLILVLTIIAEFRSRAEVDHAGDVLEIGKWFAM